MKKPVQRTAARLPRWCCRAPAHRRPQDVPPPLLRPLGGHTRPHRASWPEEQGPPPPSPRGPTWHQQGQWAAGAQRVAGAAVAAEAVEIDLRPAALAAAVAARARGAAAQPHARSARAPPGAPMSWSSPGFRVARSPPRERRALCGHGRAAARRRAGRPHSTPHGPGVWPDPTAAQCGRACRRASAASAPLCLPRARVRLACGLFWDGGTRGVVNPPTFEAFPRFRGGDRHPTEDSGHTQHLILLQPPTHHALSDSRV